MIVDSKARSFARYGAVDLIKPNAAELAYATDMPTETDARGRGGARPRPGALRGQGRPGHPGRPRACRWRVRGQPVRHFPAVPREVFDVSGRRRHRAGRPGPGPGGRGVASRHAIDFAHARLRRGGRQGGHRHGHARRTDRGRARRPPGPGRGQGRHRRSGWSTRSPRWRAQGLKVGFTNGCFDILHKGHVAYLAQARAWCDRLIVGVNTDASVRALKGEGRPVNDLESRALVLAGLAQRRSGGAVRRGDARSR